MDSIEDLLENRSKYFLVWVEPWPARDKQGEDSDAHIELKATVEHCINMKRREYYKRKIPETSDRELLLDFIDVNIAVIHK